MIKKLMAVWDKKSETFKIPHFTDSVGEAVRDFEDGMKDEKVAFSKHPEDYDLYFMAELNTSTGEIFQDTNQPLKMVEGTEAATLQQPQLDNISAVTDDIPAMTKEEYHASIQ